jgi:hypothetical protein
VIHRKSRILWNFSSFFSDPSRSQVTGLIMVVIMSVCGLSSSLTHLYVPVLGLELYPSFLNNSYFLPWNHQSSLSLLFPVFAGEESETNSLTATSHLIFLRHLRTFFLFFCAFVFVAVSLHASVVRKNAVCLSVSITPGETSLSSLSWHSEAHFLM